MKKSIISLLITSLLSSTVSLPTLVLAQSGILSTNKINQTPVIVAEEPPLRGPSQIILPDMGDVSSGDLSSLDETRLGERIMREIRKDPDYSRDLVLYDYLNQVGHSLVNAARVQKISGADTSGPFVPRFEFFGVRDQSINAFALPGGYIGIHTGLIVMADTESELASVMGHEIGHVTQKHIARSMGQGGTNAFVILASLLLAGLALRSNASAAQGLAVGGQALAIQNQLSYSRDAEREADRVGFQILQAAGYDVTGMVSFFQRLQRATGIMDNGVPAFVRTHPLTIDRISEMQDRARNIAPHKIPSSIEFYLMQARAKVEQEGKFSELLETRQYFEAQTQSSVNVKAMQGYYGLALIYLKQSKLDEATRALNKSREFAQGAVSVGSPIVQTGLAFDITSAEISIQRKNYDQAMTSARQAFRLNPGSKAAGTMLVEAQLSAGKVTDAIPWLIQKVKSEKYDPDWWDLLAQAYAMQNNRTLHHAALAEKFALEGALPGAIEQLRIARQEGEGDFYQLSEIDARMRQLQALYREELKENGKKPDLADGPN